MIMQICQASENPQRGQTLFCRECGNGSHPVVPEFVIHQRIHTGEKPMSVMSVEKLLLVIHHLRHQKIHTEKPQSVMSVAKALEGLLILVSNQRIYTGEKPYLVKYVGKPSISVTKLTRHQRIHSEVKPLTVYAVKKVFSTQAQLKRHLRIHIQETSCDGKGKSSLAEICFSIK